MAGTATIGTIETGVAGTPPVFKANGTEIGQLCRAWVNWNGATTAVIRSSFNVSSVTRNSSGNYTIAFTNAMPDANYVWSGAGQRNFTAGNNITIVSSQSSTSVLQTASGFTFVTVDQATNQNDVLVGMIAVFR